MQTRNIFFGALVFLGFSSCKKNEITMVPLKDISNTANVKIVHASAYNTNYTVQLKLNDTRVSNNITYSTPFPGGGLNTGGSNFPWYLAIDPGTVNVSMSLPKAGTSTDSIVLFTGSFNVEANKSYSAYLADTASKTQLVLVPENRSLPDNNTSRFKFVNLIPNLTAVDLYFGANVVASNIPFKGVSPEFVLPYNTTGQWAIRPAGAAATTTAVAVYPSGTGTQTIPNQRIMTVYSRGYSGATGNRAPAVSLLYN